MRWRPLIAVLLVCGVAPGTWLRTPKSPPSFAQELAAVPIALPAKCCRVGPFQLTGAWELQSRNTGFGGYSALIHPAPGRLRAFSDRGGYVDFAMPGAAARIGPVRIGALFGQDHDLKQSRDIEAASLDPASGQIWLALEGRNAILRTTLTHDRQRVVRPPLMRRWSNNTGPEAMVRLADGRFVILSEARSGASDAVHPALLFGGDPVQGAAAQPFTFSGPDGFRPTDMAQLPDGRVLVLMRQLRWPLPARFAARIVLADPRQLRPGHVWQGIEVARLEAPVPLDNYEGLAIEPLAAGQLAVWVISDDNGALSQRNLLLRFTLDPADLPPARAKQKARDSIARPSHSAQPGS